MALTGYQVACSMTVMDLVADLRRAMEGAGIVEQGQGIESIAWRAESNLDRDTTADIPFNSFNPYPLDKEKV